MADIQLHEGDRVWFAEEKLPYTVQAVSADGRWAVCTKPFAARHTVLYTILDHHAWVRGVDNSIGNSLGYETKDECRDACALLAAGDFELSRRRGGPIAAQVARVERAI